MKLLLTFQIIFLNCLMKSERKQLAGTQLSMVLYTSTDFLDPSTVKTPKISFYIVSDSKYDHIK